MEPWPVLLNHQAGGIRAGARADEIARLASEADVPVQIINTSSPEDLRGRVRELVRDGAPRVGVGGGDGTVSLAVQEIAKSDTLLGILPVGTYNNFATSLGIPRSLPAAINLLRDGEAARVSLGRVNGRYFTEAAGVGVFADVLTLYGAGSNKDLLRGVYALLRAAFSFRSHRLRITVDGDQRAEHAVLCTAANSFRLGPGLAVAPEADLMDSRLDLVVIGRIPLRQTVEYFMALKQQSLLGMPAVNQSKGKEITIESARPLNVHCDDQVIGTTPVTIRSEPAALRVQVIDGALEPATEDSDPATRCPAPAAAGASIHH